MTTVYLVQRTPDEFYTETLYATFSKERAEFLEKKEKAFGDASDFHITEIDVDGLREDVAEEMYNKGCDYYSASMDYAGSISFLGKERNKGLVVSPSFYTRKNYSTGKLYLSCDCWAKDKMEAAEILDRERIRRINEGEWKE